MRGKFRHTSTFCAGPSDTGNFNTPNCHLHSNQAHKRLNDSQLLIPKQAKMNGRDQQDGLRTTAQQYLNAATTEDAQ